MLIVNISLEKLDRYPFSNVRFTDSNLIPNLELMLWMFHLVVIAVQRVPYLLFVIGRDIDRFSFDAG